MAPGDWTGTQVPGSYTEILQENHYYPFGMNQEGAWHPVEPAAWENPYQYNGKELERDLGLDWSFYGARMYDAAIGRFTGVDPIADKFPWVSTYNYAENEPMANIDLHGLQKYKAIDKHSDIITTAPNNFIEGMKVLGERYSEIYHETLKAMSDFVIENLSIEQGSPDASDFIDPEGEVPGKGIELFSKNDKSLNAEGTAGTLNAKEGSTVILEADEILVPADAGGIVNDAANSSTQASRSMNNFGKAIENAKKAYDSAKSTEKDTIEFSMPNGSVRVIVDKPQGGN